MHPDFASVDELIAASQKGVDLLIQSGRTLESVVFSEIGLTPNVGAYRIPYLWETSSPIDYETQKRYYEANCVVFGDQIRGIHWWLVDLRLPGHEGFTEPNNFNPLGNSAEQEIASCYADK